MQHTWYTDMQRLRRHADRGLRVLDTITDGPPSGKHPNLDTRAAIDRLGTHDLKPSDRAPAIICAASGSMAIAGVWVAWILVSAVMIADGGGGAWVAWFCLGLLGCLRQASNQVTISTYGVSLRDGVAGHRDRHVAYTDIDAVWASRSTLGRWFNYGRIGLHHRLAAAQLHQVGGVDAEHVDLDAARLGAAPRPADKAGQCAAPPSLFAR